MANYYVKGYTPPAGIKSTEDVKREQRRLGVKADGIWGPNTQAAYDKQSTSFKQYGTSSKKTYSPPKGIDSVSEIKDVQRRLGVTVDGIWGKKTDAAWNNMRSGGNKSINLTFTTSNYNAKQDNNDSLSKPNYSAPKGIDSVEEIMQTQRRLGVTVDGVWGNETQSAWNAMRSGGKQSIFTAPKGIDTEKEIKQTQQRLGVKESGIWDRSTNDAWETMRSGGKISESKYTAKGFTAPEGVESPTDVRSIQKVLGVKQSGIWDMATQSAWNKQFGDLWTNNQSSKYNPPAGIDSSEEIKQVQSRLGVTTSGIWDKETNDAWYKMRYGNTRKQQEEIKTIADICNEYTPQKLHASLISEINGSDLQKQKKRTSQNAIDEFSDVQKAETLAMIDMFGINHAITQPNMLKTAKQMVKDNLNEKSVVKGDSAEAFQSSFLRPTRIGDNSIKGVDYSTYYYEDGNYYFDVLYNGDIFKNVKLGKHFPEKATISIWKYDNWDEIGRQIGYLPAIYASQGFETYTSQSLGDPEGLVIPYAPIVGDVSGKIYDVLSPNVHLVGDIVIHIYAELEHHPFSPYKWSKTYYIPQQYAYSSN